MVSLIDMELAIANLFGIRQHIIVPNLSWGFANHECDLAVIRPSGYLVEVEIKRSVSDFRADFSKKHNHDDKRIKELFYAFPEELIKHVESEVPANWGIICVYFLRTKYYARIIRNPVPKQNCVPLNDSEQLKIMRLGCMRIWKLKQRCTILNSKLKTI
jgi:hypothetical protein